MGRFDCNFIFSQKCSSTETLYKSIIWGPTCDALDMIIQDFMLPELAVGDWIYFKDMASFKRSPVI
jgi:ornithine decarboxylase